MQFEKEVIYIGHKNMTMRDGGELCSITFYVDGDTVTVNVLANNTPVVSAVHGLSFGDKCVAAFILRKSDRLYRLSLAGLA